VRQGKNYVLEISLRDRVAWSQRIDGETLALDFERPAAPAAPVTSPAPARPGK
jgi:colicin import membrane protein